MIYLDSAASYPVLPEVQDTLKEAFASVYGNSTASHSAGIEASEEIEKVRSQLAVAIGAYDSEIIFTSGATESNNIALKSILLDNPEFEFKRHIITSSIEHKCVLMICSFLEKHNFTVTYVSPDSSGIISKKSIEEAIRPDTALVSIMHVNNELGTVNPIKEIGSVCFEKGILFHVDAAQSFGKTTIDVDDLNVDLMSFSAHKIGGPKGIGAVYIRDLRKRNMTPVIHGAGQEEGLRGGTVAAPLILGFGKAITEFPSTYKRLAALHLKDQFISTIEDSNIEYSINGEIENTLPHILSITFPRIDLPLFIRKNEGNFCLAQGSACSSKEIEISHVLRSIGMNTVMGERTLRLSFGHYNEMSDIHALVSALRSMK